MRILILPSAIALSLLACQPGGGLGGGDPGWELDDAPFAEGDSQSDTASGYGDVLREAALTIDSAECINSEEELPQVLNAVVSGTSVSVTHEGVGTWCEAEWQATAGVSAGNQLSVAYTDSSGTDDESAECWCEWTLTYTISDLEPGDWTLSALTNTASFTIE